MVRVSFYEINIFRDENEGEKCRILVIKGGKLVKAVKAEDRNQAKQILEEILERMLSEIYD